MNWWNANSWCDALNKKLINRPDDCECASDGYVNAITIIAPILYFQQLRPFHHYGWVLHVQVQECCMYTQKLALCIKILQEHRTDAVPYADNILTYF